MNFTVNFIRSFPCPLDWVWPVPSEGLSSQVASHPFSPPSILEPHPLSLFRNHSQVQIQSPAMYELASLPEHFKESPSNAFQVNQFKGPPVSCRDQDDPKTFQWLSTGL